MAMTTPRTGSGATTPRDEEPMPGPLGRAPHPRRGARPVLLAGAVVLVAVVGIWLAFGRSSGGSAPATSTQPTAPATAAAPTTGTTTPSSEPTASTSEPADGWSIGGDLIGYVDEPRYAIPGTPEAGVEIGFVNSEIATSRALANPTVEEPELSIWQRGLTLSGTRDTMRLLAERGQVILTGPLSRLEVEKITMISDSEADLEYCSLDHSINVVSDGSVADQETIETFHAVDRFVRTADDHWQSTQNVRVIQDVEGFGDCLDVTVQPAQPQESPATS